MKYSTRAYPNKCVGHKHLKNPNLRDCGFSDRVDRKETSMKTTALDQERYEVACLRQDIIDEYEKKSAELLEYLNSMEAAFDQQRHEYEYKEAELLAENKELKNELEGGCRAHLEEHKLQEKERDKREWENKRAMDQLKEGCRRTEKKLKKTQRRVQELEEQLNELQAELQRKDDLFYQKTKTMEKGRKKLELENANLKRKAALGWMLGCLSELFFRLDPELGVDTVLKLVRKAQKELECGNNVFDCHMGQGPKVEFDIIQREIRRLLGHSSQRVPSCCLLQDKSAQNEHSHVRRKRFCKGGQHWRPHSAPDLTLKAAADQLEHEAALGRVASESSRSASVPETPRTAATCTAPCLAIDTLRGNFPRSSCHSSRGRRSSQHTPPSWTPAQDYLVQVNRRQSLKKMLRHLEASMTFILGQERRRRKLEGRTSMLKPTRRGIICCKHQDSTILQ
ncbi:hypothetical protein R1sor_018445 [Riccia sorocarpa]|uniref:Uncharacterized protein n=1 Tax=Riccia sorocarpa TaxID=122646 RepID=A0ABD3I9Q3_9MARC